MLILGAGLAGLGAATTINRFKDKKISFLILEGQEKAGGRIKTVKMLDYEHQRNIPNSCADQDIVDSGAQWLHGKYNYLHELSEQYDLLSTEQSEEGLGAFLYENCIEIKPFMVNKIDFVISELLTECELFAQQTKTEHINELYPKSVEHFLRERFQHYLNTIKCPIEKEIAYDLFDWHLRFQIIDNSCLHLDHVSAKHWGKYSFNGESCQAHYNYRNGFDAIINCLTDKLDESSILFKKEIVEISINESNKIKGSCDIEWPKISVKCADQTIYTANHVLVTFSLGVLKTNHLKMFRPCLPSFIEQAINDIGFETINKLFLQFETAWWGDLNGIQLIFNNTGTNVSTKFIFYQK